MLITSSLAITLCLVYHITRICDEEIEDGLNIGSQTASEFGGSNFK